MFNEKSRIYISERFFFVQEHDEKRMRQIEKCRRVNVVVKITLTKMLSSQKYTTQNDNDVSFDVVSNYPFKGTLDEIE